MILLEEHHPPAFKRPTLLIWFSETTKTMIHSVCSIVRIYTIVCDIICIYDIIYWISLTNLKSSSFWETIPHWTKTWVELIWGRRYSVLMSLDATKCSCKVHRLACPLSVGTHGFLHGAFLFKGLCWILPEVLLHPRRKRARPKANNQMSQIVLLVTIV